MLKIRFYTLGQYPQEEKWLEEMAAQGLIIQKSILPCFYIFKKEKPQNLIYRYDFVAGENDRQERISFYEEYGWRYVTGMNDFMLFVHTADDASSKALDIFSSDQSREEMIIRILKKRMLPLGMVFLLMVMISLYLWLKQAEFDTRIIFLICTLIVGIVDFSCLFQLLELKKKYS